MKKQKDHSIHKYYWSQFKVSKTVIYRCGVEGCTHFIYEPLVVNRLSLCWRCGDAFVITVKSLRSKKLHCESCTRGKHNKIKEKTIVEIKQEAELDDVMRMIEGFEESNIENTENIENQNQEEGEKV